MAENPTPADDKKGAEQAMVQFFAKLGFEVTPISKESVAKALDPVQKYLKDFNKTADVKNTFFGQLPGIKKSLEAIMPDNLRFNKALIEAGKASLNGADNLKFYNDSLGMTGKGLVRLANLFTTTGEASTAMAGVIELAEAGITLGISTIISACVYLLQGFKNLIMAGIEWQDKLNQFNKIMGGISKGALAEFNAGINRTITGIQQYGFSVTEILDTLKSYVSTGLNPVKAMQEGLIKNTLLLSEITGQSGSELAGFFSGIMRGSKVASSNIESLGNSWTAFNKSVEASGVLGVVSFGEVQSAISSVGTALLIASNRGKTFTNTLTNDLISLVGLSKALNIDVGMLNSKFEETANLVTSQESGFRAILAISGGANIGNMLNNQFNRTEAMLKVADKLAALNTQFGGNLNILGQVAEQTFGLSKDVAIKLATMSSEQRKALQQAKEDSIALQNDSMQKSWESVTNTMTSVWERFKNTIYAVIQKAVGNSSMQSVLERFSSMLGNWITQFANPNSNISQIVDKLGNVITSVFDWLGKFDWEGKFNDLTTWIDKVAKTFLDKGFWSGILKIVKDVLWDPLVKMLTVLGEILSAAIESGITAAMGHLMGSTAARILLPGMAGTDNSKPLGDTLGEIIKKAFGEDDPGNPKKLIGALGKNAQLLGISAELKQNEKEQSRYAGTQDTDIVINKQGQFTLAGLEKLDLEDKHDALVEEQNRVTEDNTKAVNELSEVLRERKTNSEYNQTHNENRREINRVQAGTLASKVNWTGLKDR